MSSPKPFKISELSAMGSNDLSRNDLFLVSDANDPRTNSQYVSKKVDYGTLSSSLASSVSQSSEIREEIIAQTPIQVWYNEGHDAPQELSVGEDEFILSCGKSI